MCAQRSSTKKCFPNIFNKRGSTLQHSPGDNLVTCCMRAMSFQSCLMLCDPMGCTSPGSSVHGILQAIILEWVAMPSSRGSSQTGDLPKLGILPIQGSNPHFLGLLHWLVGSLPLYMLVISEFQTMP